MACSVHTYKPETIDHVALMDRGIGSSQRNTQENDTFFGSYTREKTRFGQIATRAMNFVAEKTTFLDSYQITSLQQLRMDLESESKTIQFSPLLSEAKKIVDLVLSKKDIPSKEDLEMMQDDLDDLFQKDAIEKMNSIEAFGNENPRIPIFVFDVDGTINTLDPMVAFCAAEGNVSSEDLVKGLQSSDRVVKALETSGVKYNSRLAEAIMAAADTFSRPVYPKEVITLIHDLKEAEKRNECKLVLMTQSRGDTPGIQLGKLAGIERQLGAGFAENTIIMRPSRKSKDYPRAEKFGEERGVGGWQVLKKATIFVDDSREPVVETEKKRIVAGTSTPYIFRANTPYNEQEKELSKFPSIHLTTTKSAYLMMKAQELLQDNSI